MWETLDSMGGMDDLLLLAEVLDEARRERLRALEGQPQRAVPEDLRQSTDGARHAEEDRVVLVLREAVVPQQHAGVGVDVRVGIRRLAVLRQHAGHDLVDRVDDLEQFIIREVLEGKFSLTGVAGVRLAQDRMPEAGDDLASIQSLPRELRDRLLF